LSLSNNSTINTARVNNSVENTSNPQSDQIKIKKESKKSTKMQNLSDEDEDSCEIHIRQKIKIQANVN